MSGAPADVEADVDALCERALVFARSLSGPLKRVVVRRGDVSVEVDWHESAAAGDALTGVALSAPTPAGVTTMTQVVEDEDVHTVSAPLVGTFYVAPSPGEAPFVSVGSPVEVGQTLGIVEAMKLLNPIVSDVAGHVVEVLVSDAQSVEFDQPLVRVALAPASLHAVAVAG